MRTAFHISVKGSAKAFDFYQKVFDAKLLCRYDNPDGTIYHSVIEAYGQEIMIAELVEGDTVAGNNMSFVLLFGEGEKDTAQKIYNSLNDDANIICPLSSCCYAPLIDKYGVKWWVAISDNNPAY